MMHLMLKNSLIIAVLAFGVDVAIATVPSDVPSNVPSEVQSNGKF